MTSGQHQRGDVTPLSRTKSTEMRTSLSSLEKSSATLEPAYTYHKWSLSSYKRVKQNSFNSASSSRFEAKTSNLVALRPWYMELAACALAIGALLAIIATLRSYQDKPAPRWPYHLSVNALLSMHVVLLKAGILTVIAQGLGQLKWTWYRLDRPLIDLAKYDDASRGALGSLKLVWSLRFRNVLASAGAMITILMVVIDPFTQQLIYYSDCEISTDWLESSIPRSNYFSVELDRKSGLTGLSDDLIFSIRSGSASKVGEIKISCATGNCTFSKAYSTVGYCSSCVDVSENITVLNNETTRFVLPSRFALTNSTDIAAVVSANNTSIGHFEIIANNHFTYNAMLNCRQQGGSCPQYWAASCSIYPCGRRYNATINLGAIHEHEISRSREDDLALVETFGGGGSLMVVDLECLSNEEHQAAKDIGQVMNSKVGWSAYDLKFLSFLENRTTTDLHRCAYAWNNLYAAQPIRKYLQNFFNGTVPATRQSGYDYQLSGGPEGLRWLTSTENFDYKGFQAVFNNVSEAMTIYMRQHGHWNFSMSANGTAKRWQTCLRARWAWVTFPTALVVMTTAFFVSMVHATQPTGEQAQIWKSSLLAIIFHGLDLEPHYDHAYDINNVDDMEAIAKEQVVTLDCRRRGVIKLIESIDEARS